MGGRLEKLIRPSATVGAVRARGDPASTILRNHAGPSLSRAGRAAPGGHAADPPQDGDLARER